MNGDKIEANSGAICLNFNIALGSQVAIIWQRVNLNSLLYFFISILTTVSYFTGFSGELPAEINKFPVSVFPHHDF